jgi:hypothetical protein
VREAENGGSADEKSEGHEYEESRRPHAYRRGKSKGVLGPSTKWGSSILVSHYRTQRAEPRFGERSASI